VAPLAAFGGVVKRGGNRYLVHRMSVEKYQRSRKVKPIPPKARTDSICLWRARRHDGDGTGAE
jgi:hypothetical protein